MPPLKRRDWQAVIPGFFQGTEMPDSDWWEAQWPDPSRVLIDSGLIAGMTAVDLCAGDGWFTLPMARCASHVVAIDIDGTLLERARLRLSKARLSNCEFRQTDAFDLAETMSKPADFVFLANAFHGVPDQMGLSRIVAAILAPGGCFAIVNWAQRPREETTVLGKPRGPSTDLRMNPQAVIAAVEPSGLALFGVVDVPPYHYSAIFKKSPERAG
jgi:2-polyprenyl-3-methyl-5-hydroxy-6-metoxy-1,4-benzoquinol methylase